MLTAENLIISLYISKIILENACRENIKVAGGGFNSYTNSLQEQTVFRFFKLSLIYFSYCGISP